MAADVPPAALAASERHEVSLLLVVPGHVYCFSYSTDSLEIFWASGCPVSSQLYLSLRECESSSRRTDACDLG